MKKRILAFGIIVVLSSLTPALAQLDFLKNLGLGQKGGLSDVKIGEGLKEALTVGTGNTVNLTGRKPMGSQECGDQDPDARKAENPGKGSPDGRLWPSTG